MLNSPNKATQKAIQNQKPAQSSHNTETQYGTQPDQLHLLDIPAEILTGVTSHLDPPSLHNLALVNKRLYEHVKNDGTWHRAFVQQFLGVDFQSELHNGHKLLLQREAKTWRKEFTIRYHLCKKWALSRNSTIRHIPVHSVISSMHLMPSQSALLCASTVYGIVSRSMPLTGKILSGYLNPTGPRIGIGIGNPNVEFAPNVSTCLLTSDGGSAKVLWGIRNGEVAVSIADKAIDPSRRGINFQLIRCLVEDEHDGPVLDAAWDDRNLAATGSADGRIKLWDIRTMKCIWTSEEQTDDLVTDPIVKVVSAVATKGIMSGCTRSGHIVVFQGFENLVKFDAKDKFWDAAGGELSVRKVMIPCPISTSTPRAQTVMCLQLDTTSPPSLPVFIAAYEDDSHFYKISLPIGDTNGSSAKIEIFGDDSFGPISCIRPIFVAGIDQCSFVLTGDRVGCVNVYDWRGKDLPSDAPVQPIRHFEAHVDGSTVTAIHWDGTTLITGSARGTTHVFDGLTFEELRYFASPTPKFRGRGHAPPVDPTDDGRVRQILVSPDRDVLIVNVGNAVVAWKAGPIGKSGSGGVRGRIPPGSNIRGKKKNGGGKWFHSAELKQNIAESQHLLEQEAKRRHQRSSNTEHQVSLETLGLNEQEALEYAIMLSREEVIRNLDLGERSTPDASSTPPGTSGSPSDQDVPMVDEEGMFGWDTDETFSEKGSRRSESDPISLSHASSSSSNENDDARSSASFSSSSIPTINTSDHVHFPPISPSSTPVNTPGVRSDSTSSPHATNSRTSAWKTPLKGKSTPSPPKAPLGLLSSEQQRPSSAPAQPVTLSDELDEDLRFAIELSLAEARSRGDA